MDTKLVKLKYMSTPLCQLFHCTNRLLDASQLSFSVDHVLSYTVSVTGITISKEYYYCYYFIVNMLLGSVDTVMMQYRETPAEGGASMES